MLFPDGIAAQPAALAHSYHAVSAALPRLPRPRPGDVIALVGIGASEHAARGAAPVWRAAGLRAFPVSAAELAAPDAESPETDNPAASSTAADFHVLISESGRSTETLRALDRLDPTRCLALVNDPDSPLARRVSDVLVLESGEDSPVYTTGYTATLQALGLLGEHWAARGTDWSGLPTLAGQVLDQARAVVEASAEAFDRAAIVDVVASGAGWATAGEGALLLRESARLLTAAHETRNYLHGPMEPLDQRTACLIVGSGREVRLAHDTATLGCATLLVTTGPAGGGTTAREPLVSRADGVPPGRPSVLRLPTAGSPLAQAVLDILPVQLLAWRIASARGLRVDGFRHRQDDTKLA